jgi:ribonuclease R
VPLSLVQDDFFVFDAARNLLVGRRTRRVIRLGDKVTVQVAKVDSFKKQVDFRLAQKARTPFHSMPQPRREPRPPGSKPAEVKPGFTPRPGGNRPHSGPIKGRLAQSSRTAQPRRFRPAQRPKNQRASGPIGG